MYLKVLAASALAAVLGFVFLVVAAFSGISESASSQFVNCQCDSAIGSDPSATTAPTTVPGSTPCDSDEEWDPSEVPTTNPLVSMTVAPDDTEISDYHRACLSAIASASAPLQTPASRKINTGLAVDCARELSYAKVDRRADGANSATAEMIRDVIYEASVAAVSTGGCRRPAGGESDGTTNAAAPPVGSGHTAPTSSCSSTTERSVVHLPNTIAGQGLCGQRVRLDAVSPGDLIFWDYRDNAPARVGIAVEYTQVVATDPDTGEFTAGYVRVVTADPGTGLFALVDIPSDSDARAKRVLPGEAN
ncbi:hypothetical protein [Nocardia cyriacigeorgica]|uniref:hypothetical protein n=1 Tax=Nocardia cyriacigeorgica TaxID=135487 RepID=UPI002456C5B6|nr:hypothetical protein [Nocardia cyriacigeorgica]